MARPRTIFRCAECGASEPKWTGRCSNCQAWGTLAEELDGPSSNVHQAVAQRPATRPLPIADVDPTSFTARPTRIAELDRVLGGGLVPGSVTLLGGEPGIGKSTLLLQAAAEVAASGHTVLYLSGEESPQQIRLRAERVGALRPKLFLASEVELPQVLGAIEEVGPDLVVIDSIQTLVDPAMSSSAGSVGQVRECSHQLVREAKRRGCSMVLVGHVTKDGTLAGPRVLEHVVDTVLSFEGDRHHALRILRAVKHRFGSTNETGLFEMAEEGLVGLPDPSGLFLADRSPGVPGSAVVPTMEGNRPLLVELQVLVSPAAGPAARRQAQGLDSGRLNMLLAVLAQRADLPLLNHDVFALAVGGVKVAEPGADLGLALALVSAVSKHSLPDGMVAIGEIGLAGEIRQVPHMARRIAEAHRLGFTKMLLPFTAPDAPPEVRAVKVGSLAEAIGRLNLLAPARP